MNENQNTWIFIQDLYTIFYIVLKTIVHKLCDLYKNT